MVNCTRSGRERAFNKISKAFGPGVTLESVSLGKHNRSFAIWSILKPRNAVTVEVSDDIPECERASLVQDCVTLNYVVVGCTADVIQVAEGLWALKVARFRVNGHNARVAADPPGSGLRSIEVSPGAGSAALGD
jgi:hypothetical protein